MGARGPSGVVASGSPSSSWRTSWKFCPPRPQVLKHSKNSILRTWTKQIPRASWGGGGGNLKVLLLCIHSKIHREKKRPHRSLVQDLVNNEATTMKNFELRTLAVEMKSLLNYYLAIRHSDYRNHVQKYYMFNIKNEWKNTYHSWTWSGRTAGPGPFSCSCFCSPCETYHRSTGVGRRTQQSVCPARLWTALRVQGVRCLHRHCLHVLDL